LEEEAPPTTKVLDGMIVLTTIILDDMKLVIIIHRKVGMYIIPQFILHLIAYAMLIQCCGNGPLPLRGPSPRDIALPLQEFVLKTDYIVAKIK
jgi:hypothetical protein